MADLLQLAKKLRDPFRYASKDPVCEEAAAALEQAHATISAQEDRRIELAHQLATALNDLGRANAELAAERSNRLHAQAHWVDNMEFLQLKRELAERRADEATLVLGALGVIGGGYCFCSHERDPDKPDHQPECRDARAFLDAAKKEG